MAARHISALAIFLTGILIGATFSTAVVFAWTGPTQAPPNGNVSAPINVGSTDQVKNAGLSVNALAVFGNAIMAGVASYLNFGSTVGANGYGIRDNSGVMEFKNSAGSWENMRSPTIAFSVNKGNIDQNIPAEAVWSKLTWSSEVFDTNNNFANSRFKPTVAGKYIITAQIAPNDLLDPYSALGVGVFKNKALVQDTYEYVYSTTQRPSVMVHTIVDMNGTTDYLEVQAYIYQPGGGTKGVTGLTTRTTFSGGLLK